MDFTDALKAGGASATIMSIVAIAYKIVQSVCGHRLRSDCCGREGTIGIATEVMTPRSHPSVLPVQANPNPPSPLLKSAGMPEDSLSESALERPKRPSAQEVLLVDLESRLKAIEVVKNSPSQTAQSIVLAIEPLVLPRPRVSSLP